MSLLPWHWRDQYILLSYPSELIAFPPKEVCCVCVIWAQMPFCWKDCWWFQSPPSDHILAVPHQAASAHAVPWATPMLISTCVATKIAAPVRLRHAVGLSGLALNPLPEELLRVGSCGYHRLPKRLHWRWAHWRTGRWVCLLWLKLPALVLTYCRTVFCIPAHSSWDCAHLLNSR